MASRLQELIGLRVVAYATGVRSTKTVADWKHGADPHDEQKTRLRALYRASWTLDEAYGPETVRAWLTGSNPDLGERTPVDVLRDGDLAAVIVAAKDFAEE